MSLTQKRNDKSLSPMMQHYFSVKEEYPNCIIMYRLGDFYEMFFEDAVTISKFLDLTLTGRDCGLEERAPMCGIPHHALDNYVPRLIEGGFKVAICEQMNTPAEAKGMVTREVTRVITPGTLIEEGILDEKKNNYLASVFSSNETYGIAWCDVSTGELNVCQIDGDRGYGRMMDFLVSLSPAEIICDDETYDKTQSSVLISSGSLPKFQKYFKWAYDYSYAFKTICKQLEVVTLEGYECQDKVSAISACGGLMQYLYDTQKRSLSHINTLNYVSFSSFMMLDSNAKRTLELTETMRDRRKKGSLLDVLDYTNTAMGARNLRQWLLQPLYDSTAINARLDAVEELIKSNLIRERIIELLSPMKDLERLSAKIAYNNVNPKECLSIRDTLALLPEIKNTLSIAKTPLLKTLHKNVNTLQDVCSLLQNAISDDAPTTLKDGGYIKKGFCAELDEYRDVRDNGANIIASIEAYEKETTGIKTLKTGYNRVFGYYIEVSKSFLGMVPYRYERKQTLVNGERYVTPELKEAEEKIIGADEKALKLEAKIFSEIKAKLFSVISEIKMTASAISKIDSLISLSVVAIKNNYVKPEINDKVTQIEIVEGRHPVVETTLKRGEFVSNDTSLDDNDNRIMIITGPNMAGKSTYMRQVALITLLAHVGSFVPAKQAKISLTDRIFTRIGASDDLSVGQSTFMVEMVEVAAIANNATSKSLLVLDEVGRGTSTLDGLSIAWALVEYVSNIVKAKTLFATHYHELTELEGVLKNVRNYRILVKEISDKVVFLHKIARGGANKSFGIEVASLAGVPNEIVLRAKIILKKLEESDVTRDTNAIMMSALGGSSGGKQLSFLDSNSSKFDDVINILKDTNIETCSPLDAFVILKDLKDRLENIK